MKRFSFVLALMLFVPFAAPAADPLADIEEVRKGLDDTFASLEMRDEVSQLRQDIKVVREARKRAKVTIRVPVTVDEIGPARDLLFRLARSTPPVRVEFAVSPPAERSAEEILATINDPIVQARQERKISRDVDEHFRTVLWALTDLRGDEDERSEATLMLLYDLRLEEQLAYMEKQYTLDSHDEASWMRRSQRIGWKQIERITRVLRE